MITPDFRPINRDAARIMSRDKHRTETVEQALIASATEIASPEFAKIIRDLIEAGANVSCEITIKKSNQPGFVVALTYQPYMERTKRMMFLKLL